MSVRDRQEKGEVLGIEDQARADDVAIGGVASRAPPRLNLDDDPVIVMEGVYLVGHLSVPVAAEKDRAPDAFRCLLAGFDCIPELAQARGKLLEHAIAIQPGLPVDGGDTLLGRSDVSDERLDPLGWPRVPRKVVPQWVILG